MTDYYVDAATGSDGNTGGVGDPWLTIQFAVNQCAGAGNVLYVRAGTYQEVVTVSSGGAVNNPFIIQAYPLGVVDEGDQDAEIVYLDGNSYALPSGEAWPSGSDATYGLYAAANYSSLLYITASHVTIDGINVQYSKGRGIEIYEADVLGAHLTGVTLQNLTVAHTRLGGIQSQACDNLTLQNVNVTDAGNYASFVRPDKKGVPYSHPGAIHIKFADDVNILGVTSYANFGEGMILSPQCSNVDIDGYIAHDCMNELLHLNRCTDSTFQNFVLYWSTDSAPTASNPDTAISIDNEIIRNGETDTVSNCKFYNGLIVNPRVGIDVRSGENGTYAFDALKFWHLTIVNPQGVAADLPTGILINEQAQITTSEVANNIIANNNGNAAMTNAPTLTNRATWQYNNYQSVPDGDTQGAGDVYADPKLVNANATVSYQALDVTNYKLTADSPGRYTGTVIASVTKDFFNGTRADPYSIGFHQDAGNEGTTPGDGTGGEGSGGFNPGESPICSPPTFVNGEVLTAARLNCLTRSIEYLYAIVLGMTMPFASETIASDGDTRKWIFRRRGRYLHYSITGGDMDRMRFFVNGTAEIDDNTNYNGHTWSGYLDLDAVSSVPAAGAFYEVYLTVAFTSLSSLQVDYLLESNSTVIFE